MNIVIPKKVEYIINTLISHGFDAYAVGGCVRDTILGRSPKDWDITTSASPNEIKKIFKRTIDTGIQHGTVTVMLDNDGYEVTTYRIDGEYEDNRHPKRVEFTKELTKDLKRRDFTINAMAYNDVHGLIDEFGGMKDLKAQIIRCVGSADERFEEDALRILRAVRFSAQLGFEIEEDTKKGIIKRVNNLSSISGERIRVEIDKILTSKEPQKLLAAYEMGITKVVLPEFDLMMETRQSNPHHIYSVGDHTIEAIRCSLNEPTVRWALLLHDIAKPLTKSTSSDGVDHFYGHQEKGVEIGKEILKRLRFDNYTIDSVTRLIKWHDYNLLPSSKHVRKTISIVGKDLMTRLFEIKRADILAQNPTTHKNKIIKLNEVIDIYNQIIENDECVSIKDLAISGKDLIGIGFKPGKKIGNTLNDLLDVVIAEPSKNEKENLLEIAIQRRLK